MHDSAKSPAGRSAFHSSVSVVPATGLSLVHNSHLLIVRHNTTNVVQRQSCVGHGYAGWSHVFNSSFATNVAGSTSGIGQAAALLFAKGGARTIIHGQSKERLQVGWSSVITVEQPIFVEFSEDASSVQEK